MLIPGERISNHIIFVIIIIIIREEITLRYMTFKEGTVLCNFSVKEVELFVNKQEQSGKKNTISDFPILNVRQSISNDQ